MDAVKLAADLIQRRNDMKTILGPSYAGVANECRLILCAAEKEWKIPLIECGLKISKDMSDQGHDPSMVIAAIVDEVEERWV